ncbi:peptidyl-prolyl cis-trans isomerase C [Candidatus Termititenax aidoneus]|uniref:peptidylprolyl isomerase n=1 Tax=Termititenax aidoneus TaxID=2218524 RepID=A0A388T911_TERA1|nr:peptidyl-prolyl cis-trans isomerase C [Candidatus Termititenax aidoneus]
MKRFLFVFFLLSSLFAADKILATIGATNITEADVKAYVDTLPAQYTQFYSTAEGQREILNRLVNNKLLAIEAKAQGYEKNPEVLKILENVKEDIMTDRYIRNSVADITVNDTEVSKYYEDNKAKFVQPEAVRASHILVDTEEELKTAQAELGKGRDFSDVAKEFSTDPGSAAQGGDLGFFTKGQMVEPFEQAAFALKKGETTKSAVKTQFGWHIIKATDRRAETQRPLNEIRQDIREALLQQKQTEKYNQLVETAKKKYPVNLK